MSSQWQARIVGINYYPSFTTLQSLKAASKDAEEIDQQLRQYGFQTFQIKHLPLETQQKGEWQVRPHKGVKIEELQTLIRNVLIPPDNNPSETALLFFSGHGWCKQLNSKKEVFLATSDVYPEEKIYGIPFKWLGEVIQTSRVKKLIVWLDCCFSGELSKYLPTNKDYCIFTATSSYEEAYEKTLENYNQGLFTKALLEGLNLENYADGIVDSHKLAKFVQQRMAETEQTPKCFNSERSILLTSKFPRKAFIDECPYRSLSSFTESPADAQVFYGRTKLTQDLINRVRNQERLIAVFGASGSGKSSLIRAGLLYHLNKLGQEIAWSNNWLYFEPFTPTDKPLQSLLAARQINSQSTTEESHNLQADLEAQNDYQLIKQIKLKFKSLPKDIPIVLIIDQFEECFTMGDEKEQRKFIDCLTRLIKTKPNFYLIIAMRSDFRQRLREYPQFVQKDALSYCLFFGRQTFIYFISPFFQSSFDSP